MKFITKGNVIRLVANSTLPTAERVESWIFDEVIPAVLETGGYIATKPSSPTPSVPKAPFDFDLHLRYLNLCWHLGFPAQDIASMVAQVGREIDDDDTFFKFVEMARREFNTADMALRCMMMEYATRRGLPTPEPVEETSKKYRPHILMTTEHLLAMSGCSNITIEDFYMALMRQGMLSKSPMYNLVDKNGNTLIEWEVTMAGDYYGRNVDTGNSIGYVKPMWWADRFQALLAESGILDEDAPTTGIIVNAGKEELE